MAGHSQWANRKHRKARQDAKKGKIFSKMAREIMVAARQGGDPATNNQLRMAIERARQYSVPAENIERAIKRGTGELSGQDFSEAMYEGFGPGGVAIMLRILTDNRNRTAAEIRHLFSRYGGGLGESGSVAWLFNRCGLIVLDGDQVADADELLLVAMEAGADDLRTAGDSYEIITTPDKFEEVKNALAEAGFPDPTTAEVTYMPTTQTEVAGKEAEQLLQLLDALEDHDDVQDVYANFDMAEEILAAFDG